MRNLRQALVVGINHYERFSPLYGCVEDARCVEAILARHGDNKLNFDVEHYTGTGPKQQVRHADLRTRIQEFFADRNDVSLFYFSGHGHVESTGGYLVASDSLNGFDGVSLHDVLLFANKSPATNRIIVLDSCHSGIAGNLTGEDDIAVLSEGLTVLAASTKRQYSNEVNGRGLFTSLFVDALGGAAADLVGNISPGSVYAHIDQSLGTWERQRPVFKTNVRNFISLRQVKPSIEVADLQRLTDFFGTPTSHVDLDPTFEPEFRGRSPGMPAPDPVNTEKFAVLQKFNRVNLVVPVGAPHMWHAAIESKACKLTVLGQHYWRLVNKGRI